MRREKLCAQAKSETRLVGSIWLASVGCGTSEAGTSSVGGPALGSLILPLTPFLSGMPIESSFLPLISITVVAWTQTPLGLRT